jgi:hypothetical protein
MTQTHHTARRCSVTVPLSPLNAPTSHLLSRPDSEVRRDSPLSSSLDAVAFHTRTWQGLGLDRTTSNRSVRGLPRCELRSHESQREAAVGISFSTLLSP